MTTDHDALAARMFGGTTPTSQPSTRSMPGDTTEAELADRLFGSTTKPTPSAPNPYDKREFNDLDEADQAQRLFATDDPALYHGDSMLAIESAAMETFIQSPEEAREAAQQWGEVFQNFQLNSTESKAVADIGVNVLSTPPNDELLATWVEDSKAALVQDHGPKGAAQALADAQAYVRMYASREVKAMLEATGLGDHPQLVRMAAAKGRALRQAGKL